MGQTALFEYQLYKEYLKLYNNVLIICIKNSYESSDPFVSRTLFCILADLNNAVVWMVSIRPLIFGGARGIVVIVVGNGYSDTSSNTGRDSLHFI